MSGAVLGTRAALAVPLLAAGCHLLVGLHQRELDDSGAGGAGAAAQGSTGTQAQSGTGTQAQSGVGGAASASGSGGAAAGSGGGNPNVKIVSMALGGDHSCARTVDGKVYCWGDNTFGDLGLGAMFFEPAISSPKLVSLNGAQAAVITAGRHHTCALGTANEVLCWGSNGSKQLGIASVADTCNGSVPCAKAPTPITFSGHTMTGIAAGGFHTCATEGKSPVWCWGQNMRNQVGVADTADKLPGPVTVSPMNVLEIALGDEHSCARLGDGTVRCWGRNLEAEAGQSAVSYQQITNSMPVMPFGNAASIGLGISHTCAGTTAGTLVCWGANTDSQLGTMKPSGPTPEVVTMVPTPVGAIAVGGYHTCAVAMGTAYCWGRNDHGQAGGPPGGTILKPTAVPGIPKSGVLGVSAGSSHSCAFTNNQVYCWGYNMSGQLGVNVGMQTGTAQPVPFP